MAKKITFSTDAEKTDAIAKEKSAHPSPTVYQASHLDDLENAKVTG